MGERDDDYDDSYDPAWDKEDEDCDHFDGHEIDLLSGQWSCERCGFSRPATSGEIDNYFQWQRDYYAEMEREQRRENRWWRRLWRWLVPPKQSLEISDDELPF